MSEKSDPSKHDATDKHKPSGQQKQAAPASKPAEAKPAADKTSASKVKQTSSHGKARVKQARSSGQNPSKSAHKRKGGGGLAILIALIALLLSGWQWWQGNQSTPHAGNDDAAISQTLERVRGQLTEQQQQMEKVTALAQAGQQQGEKADAQVKQLAQHLTQLNAQVDQLKHVKQPAVDTASITAAQRRIAHSQARALLQLGAQRYRLADDAPAAIDAYGAAADTLKQADADYFADVLQALDKDLAALRSDSATTYAEAARHMGQIRIALDDLPFKPATEETGDGDTDADNQATNFIKDALGSLVTVRHTDDDTAAPALDDAETRQLLRIDAAQIQLDFISHDAAAAHTGLQALATAIAQTFDVTAKSVEQVNQQIESLLESRFDSQATDIHHALQALEDMSHDKDNNTHTEADA